MIGVKTPTLSIGFKLPDFYDIYNFNVGDVFQYVKRKINYGESQLDKEHYRITILSKTILNDTIKYLANKKRKTTNNYYGAPTSYNDNNISLLYYKDVISSITNYELVTKSYSEYGDDFLTSSSCYKDENEIFSKSFGNSLNGFSTYKYESETLLIYNNNVLSYNKIVKVGLGLVLEKYSFFEADDELELIGYIKNGVNTGTVYEDGFYSSINIQKPEDAVLIYPNPFADKFIIKNKKGILKIEIYNSIAKKVYDESLENKTLNEIDLSNFPNGIYTIRIETEKNTIFKKIIKSR